MPRPISSAARRALFAAQTGEAMVFLLTISHESLPAPIRVTSNGQDVRSRDETYQQFPFQVAIPRESDEAPPTVTLRIDNSDRRIVAAVRSLPSAPTVTLEVVLSSTPDIVEAGPYVFTLAEVPYEAGQMEGTLTFEDVLNEPCPPDAFLPSTFPGLF